MMRIQVELCSNNQFHIDSSPLREWISFVEIEEDSDKSIQLSDPITREFIEIKSMKFVEIP